MLAGKYLHQIDEKGRIRIPAKLKDQLGPNLFITKGANHRLFVFSEATAEKMFMDKLSNDRFATSPMSKIRLQLLSSGITVEDDKQGRTLLSQELIKFAGITKNVVTVGNLDRVEIWSEENWNAMQIEEEDFDENLRIAAEFLD